MSAANRKPKARVANDNARSRKGLLVEVDMPVFVPIQLVEVEVFAELLDSLPVIANDNEGSSE